MVGVGWEGRVVVVGGGGEMGEGNGQGMGGEGVVV